jgi:uncharacterized protein (TIGR03086 family)
MHRPDLAPAARAVADLVRGVRDEHLDAPTPCPGYTVAGMLGHVHGLAQAFTAAATKDFGPLTSTPPREGSQALPDDWRDLTPHYLDTLGLAWRDPDAWTGMTAAGGVDLPGEVAGLVALNEVVVHGWDLAQATGQAFDPGEEATRAAHDFLAQSRADGAPSDIFGPVVPVPEQARLLDRVVGLAGRDPQWSGAFDQTTPATSR